MSKILVACEYSGRVREAFRAKGHDAYSCDLLAADDKSKYHVQGDVLDIIGDDWDIIIAHPPCTYMSNSGVCHLHKDPSRWLRLFDAAEFFTAMLDAPAPKICVENPIMHKYAKRLIGGRQQTQTVQPWMFGHTEKKATCLWLKGLPKLKETNNVFDEMILLPKKQQQRLYYLPQSPDRWKIRSTTFPGIADAMAQQWSNL
jgi:hypothetical protein